MKIPGVWSQRDGRWGGLLLGNNKSLPYNISNYGCAITSVANMLWYMGHIDQNPAVVNNRLKSLGGFNPGGGLLQWNAIGKLSPDVTAQGVTGTLANANNYVRPEGHFAIIQVKKAGFPMHFVLLALTNTICDPWDGKVKSWASSGYTFVQAHLFGDKTPNFVTTAPVAIPQPKPPTPPVVATTPPPVVQPPVVVVVPPETPKNPDPQPVIDYDKENNGLLKQILEFLKNIFKAKE